jgi:hypothetical protein
MKTDLPLKIPLFLLMTLTLETHLPERYLRYLKAAWNILKSLEIQIRGMKSDSFQKCRKKFWTVFKINYQNSQGTYNATLSCYQFCSGKAMIITQTVCICSPRYPAGNAHALHCHLWHSPLYNIFYTLFHKRQDFRQNLNGYKRVCQISLQLLCGIRHFIVQLMHTNYKILRLLK